MQFYFYRIGKKVIGTKWSRALALLLCKKKLDSSKAWPWKSSKNGSSIALPNAKQT
jgi:hypothetical protein